MTTRVRTSIHDENISSFNKKWTEKLIHIERKYRFACVRRIFSLSSTSIYVSIWSWKLNTFFGIDRKVLFGNTNELFQNTSNEQKFKRKRRKPAENNTQQNKSETKNVRHQNLLWQWLKITTKSVVAACCITTGTS